MNIEEQTKPSEGTRTQPKNPLVELRDLRKVFTTRTRFRFIRKKRSLSAVDGVSLEIYPSEIVGLVGESGCGKTTLGQMAVRLVEPSGGHIFYDGKEITKLHPAQLRTFRRHMQIIFQDPFASLNPRMTVRDIISEPLKVHNIATGRGELTERVADLLTQVGLGREHLFRYPHEFSGGQRQRICIARSLAPKPSFIVADEPLSALDVSVQAQIINLLLSLQEELGLAFLFISHDLNVVGMLATRVAVMYLGKIVELADTAALYETPLHPYSKALLAAIPRVDPTGNPSPRSLLKGELPNAMDPPHGCTFHPRCPIKEMRCKEEVPKLEEVAKGRLVSCHLLPKLPDHSEELEDNERSSSQL